MIAYESVSSRPQKDIGFASDGVRLIVAADQRAEDLPALEPWAGFWKSWVSAAFLESYLAAAAGAAFHPKSREELAALFDAALVETLLSELRYDLTLHPERARWPLLDLLAAVDHTR